MGLWSTPSIYLSQIQLLVLDGWKAPSDLRPLEVVLQGGSLGVQQALCSLSLSFFLSGTFAPLRSLGTRGGAQSGDSGIRQFPGLPQEPERLGAKGREATTIWRLM